VDNPLLFCYAMEHIAVVALFLLPRKYNIAGFNLALQ
jgi:hypothetical protein